jgi:hypothetical protein
VGYFLTSWDTIRFSRRNSMEFSCSVTLHCRRIQVFCCIWPNSGAELREDVRSFALLCAQVTQCVSRDAVLLVLRLSRWLNTTFMLPTGSSRTHSGCFYVPTFPNLFLLPNPFKWSTLKASSHCGCTHGPIMVHSRSARSPVTVKANVLVSYINAAALTVPCLLHDR